MLSGIFLLDELTLKVGKLYIHRCNYVTHFCFEGI